MTRNWGIPSRPPVRSLTTPRRDDWPLIGKLFVVALIIVIGLAWLSTTAP